MAVTVFVGAYAYARQVLEAMPEPADYVITEDEHGPRWQNLAVGRAGFHRWTLNGQRRLDVEWTIHEAKPDLVIVAGWRRLVPILAPTVGFHSAKLPEHPGRAPVANAILRGDTTLTNTMLWLDEGIDTGDIIDERTFPIGTDPDLIYLRIGQTSAEMLRQHWRGLLDGTAPRRKQDMSRRGPLTPADAWSRL